MPRDLKNYVSDTTMSDKAILTSLANLIDIALGSSDTSTVHYKMIRSILHILARQMRIINKQVEFKITDQSPLSSSSTHTSEDKTVIKDIFSQTTHESLISIEENKAISSTDDKEREKAKHELAERARLEEEKEKREKYEKEKTGISIKDDIEREKAKHELAERARLEKEKQERKKYGKEKSGISIKEKDDVLIVDKGPALTDARSRVGIDLVTRSQFELLKAKVQELQGKATPLQQPTLPESPGLRTKLAGGTATLDSTMKAMKVTARIEEMEEAIGRMSSLLTALASAGALPWDVVEEVNGVRSKISLGVDSPGDEAMHPGTPVLEPPKKPRGMTRDDLDEVTRRLVDFMLERADNMTLKAKKTADRAAAQAKDIAQQMAIVAEMNKRVSELFNLAKENEIQLAAYRTEATNQLQRFNERMIELRACVTDSINEFESARPSSETDAVKEIHKSFVVLVGELEGMSILHNKLATFQDTLVDDLNAILSCLDMLKEQKCDRVEVLEGLRNKADISSLIGVIPMADFVKVQNYLHQKIENCHEKFDTQERGWMGYVQALSNAADRKVTLVELWNMKINGEKRLSQINEKLRCMDQALGDHKLAVLARQLSKNGFCGPCFTPAIQETEEKSHGKPLRLPEMTAYSPVEERDSCKLVFKPLQLPTERKHICHRWVGGSHTLVREGMAVGRAKFGSNLEFEPTRKYTDYGDDGKLYMLEVAQAPCLECNKLSGPEEVKVDGAGDTGTY